MNETLFYVCGIGLTVLALVVSAVGLRFERFPGARLVMAGVAAVFVVFVGGTMVFGWANAEDEQEHREEELAHATEESEEAGDETEAGEQGGELDALPDSELVDIGATVFEEQGCGGCHTFTPAGATGTTGPPLDSTLKGQSEQYIEQQIVDPNSDIVQDYPPDVMPQTYGEDLTPEQLQGLVRYLAEGAGEGSGGGGGQAGAETGS